MNWWIGLFLYMLMGMALVMSGVSVQEKPLEFIAIMIIVVLIDLNSKFSS